MKKIIALLMVAILVISGNVMTKADMLDFKEDERYKFIQIEDNFDAFFDPAAEFMDNYTVFEGNARGDRTRFVRLDYKKMNLQGNVMELNIRPEDNESLKIYFFDKDEELFYSEEISEEKGFLFPFKNLEDAENNFFLYVGIKSTNEQGHFYLYLTQQNLMYAPFTDFGVEPKNGIIYLNKKNAEKIKPSAICSQYVEHKIFCDGVEISDDDYEDILYDEGKYNISLQNMYGETEYTIFADYTKPTITGVKKGKTYNKSVTVKCSDDLSGIKAVKLDGKKVKNNKNGIKISQKGSHTLKVTDKCGNTKTVKFTIK